MSTVPNEKECVGILEAEGVPPKVVRHILTVTALAVAIAERCDADISLVRAGALLHDVGRSRTHSLMHAVEGASILRRRSLPENVVLIVQKHMGAGFDAEEAKEMGLPPGDYTPFTVEEKIVCHADNLVSSDRYMPLKEAYDDQIRKGHLNTGEKMLKMHHELSDLAGVDIDIIVQQLATSGRSNL